MALLAAVTGSSVQTLTNQLTTLCNQPKSNRYPFMYRLIRFPPIAMPSDPSLIRSGRERAGRGVDIAAAANAHHDVNDKY